MELRPFCIKLSIITGWIRPLHWYFNHFLDKSTTILSQQKLFIKAMSSDILYFNLLHVGQNSCLLTHWPLRDLVVIWNVQFSNTFQRIISMYWVFSVQLPSGDCHTAPLTHWGRDKMAVIFQTTFSNAFSWMKMYELPFRFHWSLFLRVQLTIFQHRFR